VTIAKNRAFASNELGANMRHEILTRFYCNWFLIFLHGILHGFSGKSHVQLNQLLHHIILSI